ncbi:phenazine biosynthesis PhzC/PhzF protein [Neokomagataea thailandica NBRC 106555]|nr:MULTISPECIES: PhzF family phenazine biosynthesis protein [Neokomagataea]GBR54115.1 phenazine biosynthesis PhzC/PhzF protein [Neokomagataea thailandica NBRC 106555]
MELTFLQVDVFAGAAFKGNPLAVVVGADDVSDAQMAQIANWTNLSETTFLLKPSRVGADYRVRIFTPERELPFAGHPTLGSAHVWRALGGVPQGKMLVQECGVGLVTLKEQDGSFAFAAPPCQRTGAASDAEGARVAKALNIDQRDIVAAQWTDNGPGWLSVLLQDRASVLALRPDWSVWGDLKVGVAGPWDPVHDGMDAQFEVRAFVGSAEQGYEDPVTGSLNAGLAQWLIGSGRAPSQYVARQGTVLNRLGCVMVEQNGDDIWIGGKVETRIQGVVTI